MPTPSVTNLNEQRSLALDAEINGSRFPGMTYEDGVANTIAWIMGDNDLAPMDD